MENKNAEITGNKPNVIVMLPFLVLVFCVYGDTAETHLLRGFSTKIISTKTKGNQPSLVHKTKTLTHVSIVISTPALPASPVPVFPVPCSFSDVSGTQTPFISRTGYTVRFIRGPPA